MLVCLSLLLSFWCLHVQSQACLDDSECELDKFCIAKECRLRPCFDSTSTPNTEDCPRRENDLGRDPQGCLKYYCQFGVGQATCVLFNCSEDRKLCTLDSDRCDFCVNDAQCPQPDATTCSLGVCDRLRKVCSIKSCEGLECNATLGCPFSAIGGGDGQDTKKNDETMTAWIAIVLVGVFLLVIISVLLFKSLQ